MQMYREDLGDGKLSASYVKAKNTKNVEEKWLGIEKLQGPYHLALIDLPFKNVFFSNEADFETFSTRELEDFNLVLIKIMHEDSILLMWTPGVKIPDVLFLIELWGNHFKNILMVWVKTNRDLSLKMGLGYYTKTNSEMLIMAFKGKVS